MDKSSLHLHLNSCSIFSTSFLTSFACAFPASPRLTSMCFSLIKVKLSVSDKYPYPLQNSIFANSLICLATKINRWNILGTRGQRAKEIRIAVPQHCAEISHGELFLIFFFYFPSASILTLPRTQLFTCLLGCLLSAGAT